VHTIVGVMSVDKGERAARPAGVRPARAGLPESSLRSLAVPGIPTMIRVKQPAALRASSSPSHIP
jgi:hypothetical protein